MTYMNRTVNIYEAKAQLSKLISMVRESGETITICKNNLPVVDLVPHRDRTDRLSQDPELIGAKYRGNPLAPGIDDDWPEEFR